MMHFSTCLATLVCLATSLCAAEPWADQRLPLQHDLELWLDAGRLPDALAALKLPNVQARYPIATWPDASGKQRHLRQDNSAARPIFRLDLVQAKSAPAVVALDGGDDVLAAVGLNLKLEAFTLFVVGAPFSNKGAYRALLSANETGKNDYVTGFNVDQGFAGSTRWETINVEGKGFGGERNLATTPAAFGTFHVLTLTSAPGKDGVKLFSDGKLQASRARESGTLDISEIHLGARHYSNSPQPTADSGFFEGCIAEVLLYRGRLADQERQRVEQYLTTKYAGLLRLPGLPAPALVTMLAPGFTIRELPAQTANLNGIRYGPDGRLYAIGYDGRIVAFRDSDNDGLEDQVEVLWDKPTLRTPTAMCWRGDDLYVVSNGKVSRFRLKDGRFETEEVVVKGWQRDDGKTGGGVDAVGLAIDRDGALYFGLGCADYSNAYRVRDGKAHYDIKSERGTILKVTPDLKSRAILCTGIRFPYALAFNQHGDLFCTDQEGETWLPGGNPLDELNHVVAGRHYGFPPRHSVHLPQVNDEPPIVGFGPQHQSTCGMIFNPPAAHQPRFGPALWENEALVAGFSRGKIWRVRLVKTPDGYVGRATLIAALRIMTLDLAVSPTGDLVVCCHSGPPDWGTGPSGPAKLFKIAYTSQSDPQPVAARAAGLMDVRLEFDRPVPDRYFQTSAARITYGEYVRAGDSFEILKPPYKTVQDQERAPRANLRIVSSRWSTDRRTLHLTTDPHPLDAMYVVTLPLRSAGNGLHGSAIELAYQLKGAEVNWNSMNSSGWSDSLQSLDLQAAEELVNGSAAADKIRVLARQLGSLRLRTHLILPQEKITLELRSPSLEEVSIDGAPVGIRNDVVTTIESKGKPVELSLRLRTGSGPIAVHATYRTPNNPESRPLPLAWQHLPWAPRQLPAPPPSAGSPSADGDWFRGEAVFFSKESNCSTCHRVRNKGGQIGPDLSNLVHRDIASVLRDIADPSAVINPDYVSHAVQFSNGRFATGIVRAEKEGLMRLVETDLKETVHRLQDIESLQTSPVSLMPRGIAEQLGTDKLNDLLTYLTTQPPNSPAPPQRSRAEVDGVLRASAEMSARPANRILNLVLVASPKDHGPGEHDYPAWQKRWHELLGKAENVRISTAFGWPERGQWDLADVMIFYYWNHDWNTRRYKDLDAFLARGGGVTLLHSACIADKETDKLAHRLGLAFQPGKSKYRHGPLDLTITKQVRHPITAGMSVIPFVDESYWNFMGELSRVQVLATTEEEGKPQPMLWTFQPGKGRVFGCILGHYRWTFDDPMFRIIVLRGVGWCANAMDGRFDKLVLDGVRLKEE